MYFKRKELEKFRSLKGPLIDVRSPGEYYKGHMPNSINIPLFDNDERSIIGTIYKKEGRKKAVIEGLKFFEKKMEFILDNLFMSIESYKNFPNKNNEFFIRIYCSRGGMRSQSIAWLLEKYKLNPITLKGGYKIYRRCVLDSFSKKLNIVVIGGKTGTGKTRLLSLLEKYKYQTIDLEGFACHRGSTFGGLGMKEQPSNEQFENIIAEKLNSFKCSKNIFVEAESANIGKCKIPHEFFNQMKHSRRIEILRSESNRLDELIDTYSVFKKEELQESVLRIKKRLGPQRTKIALDSINNEKWALVCKAVLDYYDKCYEFEKVGKTNITFLDLTDKKYDERILELINNVL
ncbi:tRNA 2-selenouridine(34) synthase MnmH [Prochlorococcus marinus str. MU1404]|uniref:tRNA 2-selenouridine(34) synthase MnmH n=1 Tax=Prochlorococcus marinus TaxID=1219 RepID=UPI001ADA6AE1|nr:tRNA 2-selenouridine(34) synthase MnmH [Prochlorococcus marinus]MBO8230090.1 tRNA 2-selenouridine(34) synthase MnmH [Prochlorococcus marinus XMU1404]MBW3073136.1 tRNA 2-selenouridine(34) synthase MnmH [Prochlorococcus marinus str. MU1404]MCR8545573.1 tRNA 2-selenouridine(34) synthase MnmH [Prochlorococcus marinus CUG1432]